MLVELRNSLHEVGRLLPALAELGYRGAVIEALGGDHVSSAMVPLAERLVGQMPVVLASRAGVDAVLTQAYRFPAAKSSASLRDRAARHRRSPSHLARAAAAARLLGGGSCERA